VRLAVFGKPVTQSLSPRIHGLFADQCGLKIDYRAIEATPETFPELVADLAGSGGRGCNITAPFKRDAWKLAGRCSESASRAQAANTLVFNGAGGRNSPDWYADSTDGEGLVNDLNTHPGYRLRGARICLIGSGGAAASVLGALLNTQPEIIYIANRTRDRAKELVQSHSSLGALDFGTPEDLNSIAPFDLIINATSVGHGGSAIRLSRAWFTAQGVCYDMNYAAAAKPLRALCLDKGIAYSDGLGMLVGQAALSFKLWTGHSPDTFAVLEVLRRVTIF
jgi:shikimate dehydrogenase